MTNLPLTEESLEIVRSADTLRRLAASDAELARGESMTQEGLAEAMRQRALTEPRPDASRFAAAAKVDVVEGE